jgi:ABC-type polar amino acid transport system ATPase subunit
LQTEHGRESGPTGHVQAAGPEAPVCLSVQGLNKWYHRRTPKENHVLRDVSLDVHEREVLVVIGPSGSGKSTLLRCLNWLDPPERGVMKFRGKEWDTAQMHSLSPVRRWRQEQELRQLRAELGMVFQHFNLFPHMTVLRNVALGPRQVLHVSKEEARQRAMTELRRVGLDEKAHSYPSQLSGGQKQRVAIARSLAMQPTLMMFDEATSALDPELVSGILNEMKRLAESGMTMIVVTHEMGFAREVGDRIVFMDDGRVVEVGPARELIASPQNDRTKAFLNAIL